MKRRLIPFFPLLFLLASTAAAQPPSKVLKLAEKALGGSRIFKIASWQRTGSIIRRSDGASGEYKAQGTAPYFYHESYDIDGFESERGYNGRSSWVRDSRSGLRTLTGNESVHSQTEALYRNSLWVGLKRSKAKVVPAGISYIEGRRHNTLVFGMANGVNIRLHFDAATRLLTREEIPIGDRIRTVDYGDYRRTAEVMQPFRMSVSDGDEQYLVLLDKVELDPKLPGSEFDFPAAATEPLPDVRALLEQLRENEEKVEDTLESYSYLQTSTRRELGKDGVLRDVESETVQLSFYKGYRIQRVVEKNGRRLDEKDQREADLDAQKRVDEIERLAARNALDPDKKGPPDENSRRVSIAEVLRASNLINPRRERFRGRDVIVFDFEPNPDFDYRNAKSMLKFFGKTAGVMWIDEKDKQVARLEAYLAESYKVGGGLLAKLNRGASFTLEQQRVNDEIWLPSVTEINLSVRVLLLKGISVNQRIRAYDYRRFATDVKDAKLKEPDVN